MRRMKIYNSPIRYQGGKKWAAKLLMSLIPPGVDEIVSPFFGGGAFELNLAYYRGIQVHGYDIDTDLVNFWHSWLGDSELVIRRAREILESHDIADIESVRKNWSDLELDARDRSSFYYLINRLNFGGCSLQKSTLMPLWKADGVFRCRDDKNGGRRIFPNQLQFPHFDLPVHINCMDFEKSLSKHQDILAYLDPPYPNTEIHDGNGFDHERLRDLLKRRGRWILSYSIEGAEMYYPDFKGISVQRRPGLRGGNLNEVIIFSKEINL